MVILGHAIAFGSLGTVVLCARLEGAGLLQIYALLLMTGAILYATAGFATALDLEAPLRVAGPLLTAARALDGLALSALLIVHGAATTTGTLQHKGEAGVPEAAAKA